jgi:hypothetical protein
VLLSVPVAAYTVALPDTKPAAWLTPLLLAAYFVSPYVVGALAGWRALPIFAGVYFVTSVLYEILFWRDDPDLAGLDDIPPSAGILFVVPILLVPMALGAASRALWTRTRNRDRRHPVLPQLHDG